LWGSPPLYQRAQLCSLTTIAWALEKPGRNCGLFSYEFQDFPDLAGPYGIPAGFQIGQSPTWFEHSRSQLREWFTGGPPPKLIVWSRHDPCREGGPYMRSCLPAIMAAGHPQRWNRLEQHPACISSPSIGRSMSSASARQGPRLIANGAVLHGVCGMAGQVESG